MTLGASAALSMLADVAIVKQRGYGFARVAGRQRSGPVEAKTGKSADRLSVLGHPHCGANALF